MHFTFSIFFLPLLMAVVLNTVVTCYEWRYRKRPEVRALLFLAAAATLWAGANIFEYGCHQFEYKQFWANVEYFGILAIPICWVIVTGYLTGKTRWINRRNILLLCIIPVITLIFVWTNQYHGLMRRNMVLDANGPFSIIKKNYGPWFWIAMTNNYTVLAAGCILLLERLFHAPRIQTQQVIILFISIFTPWIGNFLYVFNLNPLPRLDLTSTFLSISSAAMAFGIFRFQLMHVIPFARDHVLDNMKDGILVLNIRHQIVDYNPVCRDILQLEAYDRTLPFSEGLESVHALLHPDTARITPYEIKLKICDQERIFEIRITPLMDRKGRNHGTLLHLRDITDQRKSEAEMAKTVNELQRLLTKVRTLSGLLPICSQCKKIRDDQGYWTEVEFYVRAHSEADFTHSICPDCMHKLYPDLMERRKQRRSNSDEDDPGA